MVRLMEDIKDLSVEAERELARTFMGRIEWEMIVIGLLQFVVWIACWVLVINGTLALWEGFLLSVFTTAFAYLPSHAGQHGHLSGGDKNKEWLNFWVGQISLIPLSQSHDILKATHLKHHAHTNDPEKDPDFYHTHVDSLWKVAKNVNNSYNENGKVQEIIRDYAEKDPKFAQSIAEGSKWSILFYFSKIVLVLNFPLETLFLWWLPGKIIQIYLGVVFSHLPHRSLEPGRYKDTKFWTNGIPRFFNHSMQIHVMHHMYPKICHFDEPKAIEALKPFMIERGIPGADKIPEKLRYNPTITA